jgi:hypothetical protein
MNKFIYSNERHCLHISAVDVDAESGPGGAFDN